MPSEAVLYRKIDAFAPTLMLDEADAIFDKTNGSTEPLRALLNAGNRRGTFVPRCVGPRHQLQDIGVYCPKAVAAIGTLPDTITDRGFSIRMKRRSRSEPVEPFRGRTAEPEAEALSEKVALGAGEEAEARRPRGRTGAAVAPDAGCRRTARGTNDRRRRP